uniref:HECT domain-containing protein n=1 Tax=Maylandia zebra TaxID=106582 RepID=A0A3P9CMS0_9CICH
MNMIQRKMLLTLGAMGFQPAPKITFIHDESKHLPIAHTCANELQLFLLLAHQSVNVGQKTFKHRKQCLCAVGEDECQK